MSGLRVIFAGSGEFGIPTLRALRDAGHQSVKVVTQPDRPAGRGRALTPTPIAAEAVQLGPGVLRTGDINREKLPDADVMVVIAFGQKIAELETAGELHDRLALDGAPLVLRVLEDLAAGGATETAQDESLATLAPKLSRESAAIDWTRPAAEVARK